MPLSSPTLPTLPTHETIEEERIKDFEDRERTESRALTRIQRAQGVATKTDIDTLVTANGDGRLLATTFAVAVTIATSIGSTITATVARRGTTWQGLIVQNLCTSRCRDPSVGNGCITVLAHRSVRLCRRGDGVIHPRGTATDRSTHIAVTSATESIALAALAVLQTVARQEVLQFALVFTLSVATDHSTGQRVSTVVHLVVALCIRSDGAATCIGSAWRSARWSSIRSECWGRCTQGGYNCGRNSWCDGWGESRFDRW